MDADNQEVRAALAELVEWVSGYAQDDIPNDRFHGTGGFKAMERARAALGRGDRPTEED